MTWDGKWTAMLGSLCEFYARVEPEKLADYIVESSRAEIRELVERAVRREHPRLWRDLTPELREQVYARVERQYPAIVHEVFERIGRNIDQLLDVKLMVMRRIEQSPELANKIFRSVGDKELRLIINMGFVLGFVQGIPVAALTAIAGAPWVLLVCGPIVGWVTNWIAILMIFEPVEPKRILGIRFQGMFLRRPEPPRRAHARDAGERLLRHAAHGHPPGRVAPARPRRRARHRRRRAAPAALRVRPFVAG